MIITIKQPYIGTGSFDDEFRPKYRGIEGTTTTCLNQDGIALPKIWTLTVDDELLSLLQRDEEVEIKVNGSGE